MKLNTVFLKIVPLVAVFVLILGCSPKLTKDDKALLESSLKAATTANDAADRAEEAANRAEKAASDAADSARRAESAADAADRSAQRAESMYEKTSKALK